MKKWITEDWFRFMILISCIILLLAGPLFRACKKPSEEVAEQVAPATTNGFEIVVVTEPRITSEVPPPPVDSIAITNGELQLREIISRRKPKSKSDTNVVSPARLTEEQR